MKEFEQEKFDVKLYIEKEYKNASIYDLNDALVIISKNLEKGENESKNLVSQHFNKFIECKTVLETINTHISENPELKNLRSINSSCLNSFSLPEYGSFKRKKELEKEFRHIFNLKTNLMNSENHEEFLLYNKCAASDLKKASNSRYLKMLWDETADQRINFLNEMCTEIENNANNFSEMFHFFDLYFEMNKIQNSIESDSKETGDVSETMNAQNYKQKIENTILVNAKISMLKVFDSKDLLSSVNITKYGLIKLLVNEISSGIKKEIISIFIGIFISNVKNNPVDMMRYNFMKKELEDLLFIITPKINESVKYFFITLENEFINEMIEMIIFSSINSKLPTQIWSEFLLKNLKGALKISKKTEKTFLKKILKGVLLNRISTNKSIEEIRYIKEILLDKISVSLKMNMTEMKSFYDEFQQYEEDEVEGIIKEYELQLKEINKIKDTSEELQVKNDKLLCNTMFFVLKVIDEYPQSYVKILNRISGRIESNAAIYFLKDICYNKKIVLNGEDKILINKYKKMFGILNKDENITENDTDNKSMFLNDDIRNLIDEDSDLRIDIETLKLSSKNNSKDNKNSKTNEKK